MAVKRAAGGQFAKKAPAEKKATAQGFGESKIFGGAEIEKAPEEVDVLTCHVAGIPVVNLPEFAQQRILFQQTDEGIAWWEANKHRLENRDRNPGMGSRATDSEKMVQQYGDGLKAGMQPWETPDPLREVREAHQEKGFRYRFLSPAKMERDGKRGWDFVTAKLKDGTREVVKLGNMILGRMPEATAQSRDEAMRRRANAQMIAAEDSVLDLQDQVMSAARLDRVARRRGVDSRDNGIESVRGDEREMEDRDFSPANT